MPFESEKQRRYMHANHPEIAQRWEHEMAYDRNWRNCEGDTYRDLDETSEIPWVSPNIAAQDSRWTSDIPDHDLATSAGIVVRGDAVYTRHKSDHSGEAGEQIGAA